MFIAIDKRNKKSYSSKSKKEIGIKLKKSYSSMKYYYRKKYYENEDFIFSRSEELKSKQGGIKNLQGGSVDF
jgi:hypothetical protein